MRKTFTKLTLSWMDPHTTSAKGRSCRDCHTDPRSLGLGEGNLWLSNGKWRFESGLSGRPDLLGLDHPLDGLVDIHGTPLVHTSRPWLRPFNGEELERILNVGRCLPCHQRLDDPVIAHWDRYRSLMSCPHRP